jgi:AcrR family transcriptional regulator
VQALAEGILVNHDFAESSKQIRHEAQRLEILKAAASAIAEHGFHGMTMRGLARATDRGLASFYDYFSSKEDLLFSLQTDAFETMTRSASAALEDVEQPVDRLYIFVLNHLRYSAEHKSEMRVLVHEASALPAGRRKTVRLLKEGYFNICRDIVASILVSGCNSPDAGGVERLDHAEVERITYSVFGMLNWSYGWYDPRQHGSPQDVAQTIHALAVCGLVARCPQRFAQRSLERHLDAITLPPLIGGTAGDPTPFKKQVSSAEKNSKRAQSRKAYGQETV